MRLHPRRLVATCLLTFIAVLLVWDAVQVSVGTYDRLTRVAADCGGAYQYNTPALFEAGVDTSQYAMPTFSEVRFSSRDWGIAIDAWWVPAADPNAPVVILAHGLGECKRAPSVLLPAGMLHRHGFGVLLIDLRDEGSSTVDTGRMTGGAGEARDILGAWDWLRTDRGIPAARIGLFGVSLGAGAAILAMGQEPEVAATWEDSGYADLVQTLRYQEASRGWPPQIVDVAVVVARLRGADFTTRPVDALTKLAGRPIALIAGEADGLVPFEQAQQLIAAAAANGKATVWTLPGVGHVGAMTHDAAEYERRLVAFFDGSLGGTAPALPG
jgi:dipeptidyl aminopeptidase/acylaminoacyl peptidase